MHAFYRRAALQHGVARRMSPGVVDALEKKKKSMSRNSPPRQLFGVGHGDFFRPGWSAAVIRRSARGQAQALDLFVVIDVFQTDAGNSGQPFQKKIGGPGGVESVWVAAAPDSRQMALAHQRQPVELPMPSPQRHIAKGAQAGAQARSSLGWVSGNWLGMKCRARYSFVQVSPPPQQACTSPCGSTRLPRCTLSKAKFTLDVVQQQSPAVGGNPRHDQRHFASCIDITSSLWRAFLQLFKQVEDGSRFLAGQPRASI